MEFINRKNELQDLKNYYKQHLNTGKSHVYIIKASSGIGKSEFIKEITKNFSKMPVEILNLDDTREFNTFRRFVIELDKLSQSYKYLDFKEFYTKKINSSKALQLLLKISSFFGQVFLAKLSRERGLENLLSEINSPSMVLEHREYETFILKAQTENLFEYAKYVLSQENLYFSFPNASKIEQESLDLLNKLILKSEGSIFIFECEDKKVENSFKNSHSIVLKTYQLDKLSNEHIALYINLLSKQLSLQTEQINFTILQDSIKKGDLSEISIILKDFSERLNEDKASQIQSIYQIIDNISQSQLVFLILTFYTNRKLSLKELKEIMLEIDKTFFQGDADFLIEKNLLEQIENFVFLPKVVSEIICKDTYFIKEKSFVLSSLLRYLNLKIYQTDKFEYLDILVDCYINSEYFLQIKSILPKIRERLLSLDSQQGRREYFKKFLLNRLKFINKDNTFALSLTKLAYDANLYHEALEFINLSKEVTSELIFAKSVILNRCELFEESNKFIIQNINQLNNKSSLFFKLSLIKIMNLIQLDHRDEAKKTFEDIKLQVDNEFFPFLIRISNVFESSFSERLKKVEEISNRVYSLGDPEFSGLNAIYLSYLYSINGKIIDAEKNLDKARDFFGNKLIYNHMILHNEATIKFHNNDIDESIPELLNNAKLTAYDQYDLLAIYNNLLVYYILSDQISDINCQIMVYELEELLNATCFKRFIDIINYNLYHYYNRMNNIDKAVIYSNKLNYNKIKNLKDYEMKLMYETSWKLPISLDEY